MANTYSQIFYHVVFAVRNRECLITPAIKDDLYKYIYGIVKNQQQSLFIINGMPDHVHLLLNCKPDINLSHLIKEIKEHSTKFINDKKIISGKFYWQAGFGAFSIGKRDLPRVLEYIQNQEEHHVKKNFRDEYLEFLKENEIEFNDKYVFDLIGT